MGLSMRKAGRKIKSTARSVPMILHRESTMLDLEIRQEFATIVASKFGVMQPLHYNKLVEICNLAKVAGDIKPGSTDHFQPALEIILDNIHGRYIKHKTLGVNGIERTALPNILNLNDQFWKGHTTTFYNHCGAEVNAFYKEKNMLEPIVELEAA